MNSEPGELECRVGWWCAHVCALQIFCLSRGCQFQVEIALYDIVMALRVQAERLETMTGGAGRRTCHM